MTVFIISYFNLYFAPFPRLVRGMVFYPQRPPVVQIERNHFLSIVLGSFVVLASTQYSIPFFHGLLRIECCFSGARLPAICPLHQCKESLDRYHLKCKKFGSQKNLKLSRISEYNSSHLPRKMPCECQISKVEYEMNCVVRQRGYWRKEFHEWFFTSNFHTSNLSSHVTSPERAQIIQIQN